MVITRRTTTAATSSSRDIQGNTPEVTQSSDKVFDIGTIQIRALDLICAAVRPVHLPASHIQSNAIWTFKKMQATQSGDEVFNIRTIKIRTLDFIRALICPVYLASSHIQSDTSGVIQKSSKGNIFDIGAIYIRTLDLIYFVSTR